MSAKNDRIEQLVDVPASQRPPSDIYMHPDKRMSSAETNCGQTDCTATNPQHQSPVERGLRKAAERAGLRRHIRHGPSFSYLSPAISAAICAGSLRAERHRFGFPDTGRLTGKIEKLQASEAGSGHARSIRTKENRFVTKG